MIRTQHHSGLYSIFSSLLLYSLHAPPCQVISDGVSEMSWVKSRRWLSLSSSLMTSSLPGRGGCIRQEVSGGLTSTSWEPRRELTHSLTPLMHLLPPSHTTHTTHIMLCYHGYSVRACVCVYKKPNSSLPPVWLLTFAQIDISVCRQNPNGATFHH